MRAKALNSIEREKIFSLFLNTQRLKFTELEKSTGLRSNLISYHLKLLISEGLIVKHKDYYSLTIDAEKLIPIFPEKEVGSLPIVLVAIVKDGRILLMKRNKRPYKDYWGVIGGKLLLEESIKSASLRLVKEKTGLDVKYASLNSVMHERVRENGMIKHSFVLFFTKVLAKSFDFKETASGRLKWFDINRVKTKVIPSDLYLIRNELDKKADVKEALIRAEGTRLKSIKFLE